MVIVVVATVIGVTALSLASQESGTVSRKNESDVLMACANAASQKLWSEYALAGPASSGAVRPTVITGADLRMAVEHFDTDLTEITEVSFDDSMKPVDAKAASGGLSNVDDSNTFRTASLGGQPYLMVAHCRDRKDNQYEVELLVKFGF
ncbi:MAG TPA: hypothetical protein VEY30_05375 [Myxococcaceae bacterium]|nr:hypothetical protein [Myxococcaceae bacterium]